MNALEVLTGQEPAVAGHVPRDMTGVGHDLRVGRGGDEPPFRLVEIALVSKWKLSLLAIAQFDRELRRRFSERVKVPGRTRPAICWKQRGTQSLALRAN